MPFTGHGYRPYTWQKVQIGAGKDGKFQSIIHEAVGNTSSFENFSENPNSFGRTIYECPNYDTPYSLAKLDLPTPTWMRAWCTPACWAVRASRSHADQWVVARRPSSRPA